MEELGVWVTVPAQILAGSAITPAADKTVAQIRASAKPERPEASGSQMRQPTRSPATTATDAQHRGPALPDSIPTSASGSAHSAGRTASALPVSASEPAMKARRGMPAGTGRQPVETSSQRQRLKPRRAPAVILDVIDDRMANGADGELDTGPAASAAVPVYERAAAALGTAVPTQPGEPGCTMTADGGPSAANASVQAEQAAPQGSAAGADATAANRPADGHAQAAPSVGNGMLVSQLGEPAVSLTDEAGSCPIERPAEEQHQIAARSADLVAGNDRSDRGTPAPAVHAASPLPEVAALSLEATHDAVTAAEHEAAEMQLVVQHAAAAHAEVQGPSSGADSIEQPHGSIAGRAANVASPAESPPGTAAHGDRAQRISVDGVQPSGVTAAIQSAAAAGQSATGTQRRPKKRRRKATGLRNDGSLSGA